jgi:hypothetical protein
VPGQVRADGADDGRLIVDDEDVGPGSAIHWR